MIAPVGQLDMAMAGMASGGAAWGLGLLAFIAASAVVRTRSRLPSLDGRPVSTAPGDAGTTTLGRAIAPQVAAAPGKSGIHPLPYGRDAFAARILLAAAAERTLDVQYYIWRQDKAGGLLFAALRAAAGRGVHVRLLLDDNNSAGLDPTLAVLDAHPNIEVRLFNPFVIRKPRLLGYLTDFFRLNRRMHNKSFTADTQATIIGGRNVGDEYFGTTGGTLFADLDVLAVGPVVGEVSRDFDRYWTSDSSYPLDRIVPPATPAAIAAFAATAARMDQDPAAQVYGEAVRESPFVRQLVEGRLALQWATARMVSDDPAKGLGQAALKETLGHKLMAILGRPRTSLSIVSPYFVPTAAGVAAFGAMAAEGVTVSVLTNSLEATDVAAVHAGYAKRRKALLKAGITLYESKRFPSAAPRRRRRRGRRGRVVGSSGSSLHAKTFAVDAAQIFIGSFNFDPRSAHLNTELGFVIESPALAGKVASLFRADIAEDAYEARLSATGKLYWIERRAGRCLRHDTEPGASLWRRAGVALLALLPIDWLL